jgi:hypothetical protein
LKSRRNVVQWNKPPGGETLAAYTDEATQWKAWLALYHGKLLVIAKADDAAPRGPKYAPTDDSRTPAASG